MTEVESPFTPKSANKRPREPPVDLARMRVNDRVAMEMPARRLMRRFAGDDDDGSDDAPSDNADPSESFDVSDASDEFAELERDTPALVREQHGNKTYRPDPSVRAAHVRYLVTGLRPGALDTDPTAVDVRMSEYEHAVLQQLLRFVRVEHSPAFPNARAALETGDGPTLDLYSCADATGCRSCIGNTPSLCDHCARVLFHVRQVLEALLAMRRCTARRTPTDAFLYAEHIVTLLRLLAASTEFAGVVRLSAQQAGASQ